MKILNFILLLSLFVLSGKPAEAFQPTRKVLVSIGDLYQNNSLQWRKETCALLHSVANQVSDVKVDLTCRHYDTTDFADRSLQNIRHQYEFHLRVLRSSPQVVSVDAHNWSPIHSSDFTNVGWKFKDSKDGSITKEQALVKALANFFLYITHDRAFKAGLLVNGVSESKFVDYDQKRGLFIDRLSNEPIPFNKAFAIYEGESERKKNYLRTGIQLGAMLSAGMAIYYKNLVYNRADFDYGFTEGLRKKTNGQAVLFDDNDKFANYGHVYAGVLYYQTARANGFNSLESFLVSFASSVAWEFMEYHEVLSINDQILTPIGGYAIGEASYQISCALLQKGTAGKIVGYTINPGLAMNHAIDKASSGNKYASQPDCKKPRWSDISMYLGLEKGQKSYQHDPSNTYVVGLDAQVVTIDGYSKPGQTRQLVYDTAMVKAMIEKSGGDGMGDLKVIAQVVAAAYNQKDLQKDERGELRGYDLILGVGTGTTWRDRGSKEKSANEDFYGTINILGATAHANVFYNGYNIRAEIAYYGDFAMVKSWALDDHITYQGGNLQEQNAVVRKRGYYWGWGTSTLAAISISKGRITAGYEGQFSNATSTNSRSRSPELMNNPASFQDEFVTHKVYVRFQLRKNLSLQVSHEVIQRSGSANGISSKSGTDRKTSGALVYLF